MMRETQAHLRASLAGAPIAADPWPHSVMTEVFPWPMYEAMCRAFPMVETMPALSRTTTQRRIAWLRAYGTDRALVPFWEEFRDAVFPVLREALQEKFSVRGEYDGGELVYDHPGYALAPHTDLPNRLVTLLVYLPLDVERDGMGTVLLRSRCADPMGSNRAWDDPAYQFEPVVRVPYQANAGLCFVRSDWTFHAVRRSPAARRVFCYDIFRGTA